MFNMHVLCFDVTATKHYRKLLFLGKNNSKQYLLFQINGRISGDNAVSPY